MALAKEGYRDAQQLTTKVNIWTDENGHITDDTNEATGSKAYTISRANAANGLTENNRLFSFFADMLGGKIVETSNTATVKWQV